MIFEPWSVGVVPSPVVGRRQTKRRPAVAPPVARWDPGTIAGDPVVIRRILTHLGLPTAAPARRPPPADLFDWS